MSNDKLAEQSMDFAVQIVNLVKQLKEKRESIISNQIGRNGTSFVQIFVRLSMHTARLILYLKCRLL